LDYLKNVASRELIRINVKIFILDKVNLNVLQILLPIFLLIPNEARKNFLNICYLCEVGKSNFGEQGATSEPLIPVIITRALARVQSGSERSGESREKTLIKCEAP